MSSKDENEKLKEEKENEKLKEEKENKNENENENGNENVNENDETLMSSNEDDEAMIQNEIKELNDHLDEIIDKSKSFEDQMKSIKKVKNLDDYYYVNDFGDKELKFKIFKLKLAHLSNETDENLFEQICGLTLETLANKLINTTKKEENQIIVKNIEQNKEKIYKEDEFVIQPKQSADLRYTIDLILDFNETIQLDLI